MLVGRTHQVCGGPVLRGTAMNHPKPPIHNAHSFTYSFPIIPIPSGKHAVMLVLGISKLRSKAAPGGIQTHFLQAIHGESMGFHDGSHLSCKRAEELPCFLLFCRILAWKCTDEIDIWIGVCLAFVEPDVNHIGRGIRRRRVVWFKLVVCALQGLV